MGSPDKKLLNTNRNLFLSVHISLIQNPVKANVRIMMRHSRCNYEEFVKLLWPKEVKSSGFINSNLIEYREKLKKSFYYNNHYKKPKV